MLLRDLGRRLIGLAVSLLVASLLIFLATNALPGSIANVVLGTQASPGEVAAFEARHGLSRPLLLRYLEWLSGVLVGDFGTTFVGGRDVLGEILPRLGISVWLVVLGMLLALVIAIPLGSFAALRRRHVSGFVASMFSQAGLSVPAFWAGMWLVIVFAVNLRWLPAGGYVPLSRDPSPWMANTCSMMIAPTSSVATWSPITVSSDIAMLRVPWRSSAPSLDHPTARAVRNQSSLVTSITALRT